MNIEEEEDFSGGLFHTEEEAENPHIKEQATQEKENQDEQTRH